MTTTKIVNVSELEREAGFDTSILFRKQTNMSSWNLPFIKGGATHKMCARNNKVGKATASALLIRGLIYCARNDFSKPVITENEYEEDGMICRETIITTSVESHSREGESHLIWLAHRRKFEASDPETEVSFSRVFAFPRGGSYRLTYHIGILAMLEAVLESSKPQALNTLEVYQLFKAEYEAHGDDPAITSSLMIAADELYYQLVYGSDGDGTPDTNKVQQTYISHNIELDIEGKSKTFPKAHALSSSEQVASLLDGSYEGIGEAVEAETVPTHRRFKGWQGHVLYAAMKNMIPTLCSGPTGTAKTMVTHEVAMELEIPLISVAGKKGLEDLDFFGALLPQEDGTRKFVYGPLARAMLRAQEEKVILFIDEINRIPPHHLNMLLGVMTPRSYEVLKAMGLPVSPDYNEYYFVEIPMTSEQLYCPTENLEIVGAGNFGRAYNSFELDPAVRRRFGTVIDFRYPDMETELQIVEAETSLTGKPAELITKVAEKTREMMESGELPGCIDTATVVLWAKKIVSQRAFKTTHQIMNIAYITWSDTVCGRSHMGNINDGIFIGLVDYAVTTNLLPKGSDRDLIVERPE